MLPFVFVNVEKGETNKPNRIPYVLTDDMGRKWSVVRYTDTRDLIEYNEYPKVYRDMAGIKERRPLWRKINNYIIDTIDMWGISQELMKAGMSEEEAERGARVIRKI